MVKCPNCKQEDDYEITYIRTYDYVGDSITLIAEAECCDCGHTFLVKEFFSFDGSENV